MAAIMAKPSLKTLKCTQCGGAIELRGGHNVRSIVCQYCGSCLDSKDQFKLIHKFLNQKRPFMPLKIGASGKLKGILFTVIGVLQYEEREAGEFFRWLEYLLFSPTHGYVWLCFEDGHWVMMHEVKDLPETQVEIVSPRKTRFKARDKTFKVFENAQAHISYVEGELTWQAKQNEKILYLDAVCPPYMYSIEMRGSEQEFFWGEYISVKDINAGFRIESFEPATVFSCQPFVVSPLFEALSKGALIASVITLVMYFLISSSGTPVMQHHFGNQLFADGETSKEFKVDKPGSLYGITVHTPNLKNAWSFFDVRVVDRDETNKLFTMPTTLSFYDGYEDGEYWSEGDTEVVSYFRIPEAGEFKLAVDGEGGTGEEPAEGFSLSGVNVSIREGVRLGHYTLTWFVLCLLAAAPYFVKYMLFEQSRWHDDEEDDD
ncbi:MAG: DUF4178 domain-containing protein [Candidatus Riflebacteria bacterium]|jgi:hypothetical protein|nr:DUF4178 domain-containing protein [Candidatus Riflebacteria bacterium]